MTAPAAAGESATPGISGYIEGYFGALLRWDERQLLLAAMAEGSLSHWLYAPKADPLHRSRWRQPYPAPWRERMAAFCAAAGEAGVRVVGALAPGLDWDWDDPAEFGALAAKYGQLLELGCSDLALLYDDIEHVQEGGVGAGLARRQADICRRLRDEFPPGDAVGAWWFCPTQYCTEYVGGVHPLDSPYMRALRDSWEPGTRLLWTGESVVSPPVRGEHFRPLEEAFGQPPVLWDNFYAVDWCPRRLNLAPMPDHDPRLPVMLNPTGKPLADALYLRLLGARQRGEDAAAALRRELAALELPRGWEAILPLCASPLLPPAPLPPAQARRALEWLRGHLADPHPFVVEWYPVLASMRADLDAQDPRRAQRLPPSAVRGV